MSRNPITPDIILRKRLNALSPDKQALLRLRLNQKQTTGNQAIIDALLASGITHIYSLCGEPIQETLATAARAGIRVIGTHHQQAAVMMAVAQNYSAGRTCAAVIVSAGPAVTNISTGLLIAKDNAWPVVVLGGKHTPSREIVGQFQELDGAILYRPITKWSGCITETADISATINNAFHIASTGRPGPVYLDITEDVLNSRFEDSNAVKRAVLTTLPARPELKKLEQIASLIRTARRPALIIGKGTRWHTDITVLQQLVWQQKIAFITSPMGRGILPDDHALCFNPIRSKLQDAADVVLVLGARLDWTFRHGSQINPDARVIHVDIDPEEVNQNNKVTDGITADTGFFLTGLAELLTSPPDSQTLSGRNDWHRALAEERNKREQFIRDTVTLPGLPMSPFRLMHELKQTLPDDTILVVDGKTSMMAAQQVIPANTPFSRLTPGSNGCIGSGVPFGIGAAMQNPTRPVVVISSDTGFGMSGMELETAVRYKLSLIVVVINNDGISGTNLQRTLFADAEDPIATFQPGIRYDQLARSLGAEGLFVDRPEQIDAAMKKALSTGKSTCINVIVAPDAQYISEL